MNCTQCKRHEAPNALAFGRNSPGDCFVASVSIPPSLPTANPPPNRCPSPLSLRDISPHRGESPFTREAYRLQNLSPPAKGGKRHSRRRDCAGDDGKNDQKTSRRTHVVRRLLHSVHSLTFLGLGVGGIGGVIHLAAYGAGEYILLAGFFNADLYILGLYILLPHYLAGEGAILGGHL